MKFMKEYLTSIQKIVQRKGQQICVQFFNSCFRQYKVIELVSYVPEKKTL